MVVIIVLSVTCDRWRFSPGTLVSSTNKIGRHDITEILLKVAFKHIRICILILFDSIKIDLYPDYSVLCNNAVRQVIFYDWHFT